MEARPALRSRLSVAPPAGSAKVPLRGGKARSPDNGNGRGRYGAASGRRGCRVGALRGAGTVSAHLDEELDEGLFVLLLQPVQGHRQRHGRLGWAPRTAAAAAAPGLLWLRVPAAPRSLAGQSWRLAARGLRSSAPPHASRATRRGLRSQPLQTAGRSPVGGAGRGGAPAGALGSCGGNGRDGARGRGLRRGRRGSALPRADRPLRSLEDAGGAA